MFFHFSSARSLHDSGRKDGLSKKAHSFEISLHLKVMLALISYHYVRLALSRCSPWKGLCSVPEIVALDNTVDSERFTPYPVFDANAN